LHSVALVFSDQIGADSMMRDGMVIQMEGGRRGGFVDCVIRHWKIWLQLTYHA